jgi:FkbM family methyltransferase
LRFNAGNSNPGYGLGTTEPLVQDALVRCLEPGGVLYDVGANLGFFTVIGARLVGQAGRVYAFDPLQENVDRARLNAGLNGFWNVTVFEQAISSKSGKSELLLAAEPTWAKLASTGARADTRGRVRVDVASIDALVGEGSLRPPDVVKIDVEGGEVDALIGMRETVARHQPVILCELHGTNREVSQALDGFAYWQVVLEERGKSPAEAHWNAHVLAGPAARKQLIDQLSGRPANVR